MSGVPAAVRIERDGPLAVLRLDRPEGRNSFDVATLHALLDAVRSVVRDPSVRAVVLTGSGRYFCTGADVAEMKTKAKEAARHFDELTLHYHGVIQLVHQGGKPFVAAVNGIAAGGGVGLALSCDLVVLGRSARYVLAYANLGVSPDGGATAHLVRAIGPYRAREAILVDGGITAEQALEWGLANRVVDDDQVVDAAKELARAVAERAPHTVRWTQRLVELASHEPFGSMLEHEREGIIAAGGTRDFQEGLAAFHEKRKPRFAGP